MSLYGRTSTTEDVLAGVDLTGKRILVTGVSSGLGAETVRALASHGAQVVGTARDLEQARAAAPGCALFELDLASLASVRSGADAVVQDGKQLDGIIANAGVMACPFGKTTDGFEMQFGTNHLGHFLFVNRIAPLLRPGARLICLSSQGHRLADVDLDDPNFERTPYVEFVAYGRSKTANALFAAAFDKRHRGRGIRAASVHPGGIRTPLMRYMSKALMTQLMDLAGRGNLPADQPPPGLKSVEQGAATSVWAACVADAAQIGGRYCEDCQLAPVVDGPEMRGVRSYALDPARAEALWALSERMVGETFA